MYPDRGGIIRFADHHFRIAVDRKVHRHAGLYWLSDDDEPQRLETDFDFSEVWPFSAIPTPNGGMLVATLQQGLLHV